MTRRGVLGDRVDFDTSDLDEARAELAASREKERWLQAQLARALASRGRMFAMGFEAALDVCEQGITPEELRALISKGEIDAD